MTRTRTSATSATSATSGRSFEINGIQVAPGERRLVALPIAQLHSHDQPLMLPIHVLHGRRPGPTVFVSAAIHGDELNGVEIVRRLLRQRQLERLAGTLLAIPIVNGLGFMQRMRYLPDGRDLNRSFPGSPKGSVAARMAHRFFSDVVARCDYGIDLHTASGERDNLPQIRADLDDPATRALALAFGVPVVIHSATLDGSLRGAAADRGVPCLVYEGGRSLHYNELCIRIGLRGVLRTLRHVGMLSAGKPGIGQRSAETPPSPPKNERAKTFIAQSRRWLRVPMAGAVVLRKKLGDYVSKGETIAEVYDPYDMLNGQTEQVLAENDGVIVGLNQCPVVYEGDALVHVAEYERASDIAEQVEEVHQRLLDDPAR